MVSGGLSPCSDLIVCFATQQVVVSKFRFPDFSHLTVALFRLTEIRKELSSTMRVESLGRIACTRTVCSMSSERKSLSRSGVYSGLKISLEKPS